MQHKATRSWSLPAVILALVLAAALVAQVLAQGAVSNQAFAAVSDQAFAEQTPPIADGNTTTSYQTSLGGETSTCYAGRVWTDKTVYTENAAFENENTIEKGNSNFLVAYSAMATSQSISGKTQVPVDVVFVIDNSNSMDASVDGSNQSRLGATVDAVNASIKKVMESNENSRVAVVIYGLDAETLLPLGHYSPMQGENYVKVEFTPEKKGYQSTTFTASGNRSVTMGYKDRGTNTHMGVAMGMDILANANPTSMLPDGSIVPHVPALILLSDGASTAAGDGNWWNPFEGTRRGDGVETATSYAFAVAMNAMYMKQQVNKHYGVEPDSNYATKIYTIGMGIEQLKSGSDPTDYYRAQMALDPGTHINDDNEVAQEIRTAWNQYSAGKSPTLSYYQDQDHKKWWSFAHPTSGDIDSIVYNDGYFPAENAKDVVNVFDNITGSILAGAPFVPTETDSEQPDTSGYITYTDPIGPYMEVKDVKALLWSGKRFDQKEKKTSDNTTTYTFKGEIKSPVYGTHDVSEIQITVTTDPSSRDQTLTVMIPASCIPLRVNTIMLNSDGKVESNQSNGAYPFRLLYTVDLKDDVITDGRVNPKVVPKDYIDANTEDGKVNFYSNQYSRQTQGEGNAVKTVGDAKVTFTPASDNPFYFVQKDTPLYLSEDVNNPATDYDESKTYYFQISYYEGTELKTAWVSRSADLMGIDTDKGTNGQLYLKAGSPRWGSLTEFIKDKDKETDKTNTASTSYYPTLVDNSDSPTGNYVVVYLGNNGKLQVGAPLIPPGNLTISKTVEGNQGEIDRDFMFDVTLTNRAETLAGSYTYTKTNADATQTTTGTVSVDGQGRATFTPAGETTAKALTLKDGETVTLKDGETVTISELPAGTSFTVTEQDPNTKGEGYETSITVNGETQISGERTASGAIVSNDTQTVAYTNTWNVLMHTFTFTKIDGTDSSKSLPGARFKLFKQVCSHDHDNELIEEPFEPGSQCWKLVTDADHSDGVFTSDPEGKVSFENLLANGVTYRLIEVQAPDGFQRPQGQWKLVMEQKNGNGATGVSVTTQAVGALNQQPAFKVENMADYYLPNYRPIDPPITGGRGLTGFMLGGGLLIAAGLSAAAFWLIRSSKQKRNYRYR